MMIKIGRIQAIQSLIPDSGVYGYEDNPSYPEGYTGIIPTDSEIQAEITRLQTEYDNNLFQRQRATDYPSLQDQADMQYWDSVNGTTTWLDAINEIKTRYPKP